MPQKDTSLTQREASGGAELLPDAYLEEIVARLRIIHNPLRFRILHYLLQSGAPRTVSEIVEHAGAGCQPCVSFQLQKMFHLGIVDRYPLKNHVFYFIAADEAPLLKAYLYPWLMGDSLA